MKVSINVSQMKEWKMYIKHFKQPSNSKDLQALNKKFFLESYHRVSTDRKRVFGG